jgi:muramoyltetrapeptide carboxypeptidase
VAPASPFDANALRRGVERLRERYEVSVDASIFERTGYFAGDDDRRSGELLTALRDPNVAAIVAARGGYGTTRLLDRIDVDEVRRAGKLFVGFSDTTALHAAWARAGLRSLHAPMVAALGRADAPLLERWIATVEGRLAPPVEGLARWATGTAEGPLVGGNLAVLAALVGTPYAPPPDGCVLFLEDVGERPYRVDRMLTTLLHAGWLARVAAVVVGAFSDCAPGEDGTCVEDVLRERLGHAGVPVLAGLPAGHVKDNLELPLGALVRVDASEGRLTFLEAAVTPG